MKKLMALLCTVCLASAMFAGCGGGSNEPGPTGDDLVTDKASIQYGFEKLYTKSELTDPDNGFSKASDVTGARFFINGGYQSAFQDYTSRQDIKLEFYNGSKARFANVSGGMAYTVPADGKLNVDYTIGKYRTQITLGDSVLTVSAESSNPYTSNANPWETYRDDWLTKRLEQESYYTQNGLEMTEKKLFADTTIRPGFDVYRYSIKIKDEDGKIERPYYNIGIIREENENVNFALFVMKSKEDRTGDMTDILMSYTPLSSKGVAKNYFEAGAPQENPKWNAATKAYYQQLQEETKVNWGVFSYSMPGDEANLHPGGVEYDNKLKQSIGMQKGIEEAWDYKYDIFPTYTHISWGANMHHFPTDMAPVLAGGDGKNGKPVLQFTYQFTRNDNNCSTGATPMFDVMRGKFEDHFRRLAKDIKAYGQPVLFRLNNEMNTDWTSYSGIMTLLDPDIFNMTWRYLYEIFEQENVDNCIWIWNPIAISCPYSSWGEDLCYNPGVEYVQLLGLTDYEFNNDTAKRQSFEAKYSALYEKNQKAWGEYRAIISEFACGSGGNIMNGAPVKLGRNADYQTQWVKDMFDCFNAAEPEAFAKQIVGAVWFNCNDGIGDNITNRLRIYDDASTEYKDLAATLEAFREGLKG